jgi:hypothetical protein
VVELVGHSSRSDESKNHRILQWNFERLQRPNVLCSERSQRGEIGLGWQGVGEVEGPRPQIAASLNLEAVELVYLAMDFWSVVVWEQRGPVVLGMDCENFVVEEPEGKESYLDQALEALVVSLPSRQGEEGRCAQNDAGEMYC